MAAYSEVAKEDKEAGRPVKEPLVKEKEEEEGEEEEDGPMSLLRKAAFISSILFSLLLCSVSVNCGAVHHSEVQIISVQYSAVQFIAVQCAMFLDQLWHCTVSG